MLHITYNLSDDFGWNGNGGLDVDEHNIPTDKMNHEYLLLCTFSNKAQKNKEKFLIAFWHLNGEKMVASTKF